MSSTSNSPDHSPEKDRTINTCLSRREYSCRGGPHAPSTWQPTIHNPEINRIPKKSSTNPNLPRYPIFSAPDGYSSDSPSPKAAGTRIKAPGLSELSKVSYSSARLSRPAPNLNTLFLSQIKGTTHFKLSRELKLWTDKINFLRNEFLDLMIFFVAANQISQEDYDTEISLHTTKTAAAEAIFVALRVMYWQNAE